jgi:hypothetical protein
VKKYHIVNAKPATLVRAALYGNNRSTVFELDMQCFPPCMENVELFRVFIPPRRGDIRLVRKPAMKLLCHVEGKAIIVTNAITIPRWIPVTMPLHLVSAGLHPGGDFVPAWVPVCVVVLPCSPRRQL